MNLPEFRYKSVGSVLMITLMDGESPFDVSNADDIRIIFKKRSGNIFTVSGVPVAGGVDGRIMYEFQEGDLDELGEWKVQAFVRRGPDKFYSAIQSVRVAEILDEIEE